MAYNPAADADCQAWWRLEDGALEADSSGKGNTLSNNGVVANTAESREGSACGVWAAAASANMGIDSADLGEGYPFRPGSANRIISLCFWMKLASLPGPGSYFYAYVKWLSAWVLVYNDGVGAYIALVSWFNGGGNYEMLYQDQWTMGGSITYEILGPMLDDMRIAREFVESVPFDRMSPDNSLLSDTGGKFCLAKPGLAYAIYMKTGAMIKLDLSGVRGAYRVRWHNVTTGETADGPLVLGGGWRSLGAPAYTGDVACRVTPTPTAPKGE